MVWEGPRVQVSRGVVGSGPETASVAAPGTQHKEPLIVGSLLNSRPEAVSIS